MNDPHLIALKQSTQFIDTLKALFNKQKKCARPNITERVNATLHDTLNKDPQLAQFLAQAAIEVFPNDPMLQYNASCAHSLNGYMQGAASCMKLAIANGYADIMHFEHDDNLQALREHPLAKDVYTAFVNRLHQPNLNGATEPGGEDGGLCPVCLAEFQTGEAVNTLLCLHTFHRGCMMEWAQRHNTCPVCRKVLPDWGESWNWAGPSLLAMTREVTLGQMRCNEQEASSDCNEYWHLFLLE
eukprot:TRINITY_DN67558_c6_g1_i2.p1 TRINITY_DN67558_c6_g1~~TRINITY_DN67558_c6_g1_i2.p1  ORF type:complete len:242 (+),score=30.98 TRINITY_DN67558_c6_g1_i2:852-1577(+)